MHNLVYVIKICFNGILEPSLTKVHWASVLERLVLTDKFAWDIRSSNLYR